MTAPGSLPRCWSRSSTCSSSPRARWSATTGSEALRLVDEVGPDAVILDVGLPEMDGFEVARRIRANEKHARVRLVAVTGYGQAADRVASSQAGFDDHLVKPVHAE